ncbi:MATE family efflux transporter [Shimia ponticola]|uniref:MATE family efflux transporter n=1 Tax=Shimia ponticola TaxID=2582893 RepID=UPI0011BEBF31|nr:MATE family efflux transporter [Shimia ponticola]
MAQDSSDTRDLTKGPVWRALTVMSAPMSLGIFAVLSVGIADAVFLGRYSSDALAAVGFIYPVTTAITSLSIGLSAGANAAISQGLGRQDDETATCRRALHAVGLGSVLAVIVALLVWLSSPTLFGLIGADGAALEGVLAYMPIWAMSFPFLVLMMQINAVFRAHGRGGLSAGIMVLAAVVNIILDPILIFGLGPIAELGIEGAAWATFAGRVLAVAAALLIAMRRGYIALGSQPFANLWDSVREITNVGAPAAFSNAINPAGMAAVTAAVATVGTDAVAGFGAATRVQSIALVPLLALSSGIGPVVGQNWGADKQDRARAAMGQSIAFCIAYALTLGVVLILFGQPIAALVTGGADGTEQAGFYLAVVGWSLFGYGILVTANAAMNARSKALWSMGISIGRVFAIYIPAAWIGVTLGGYTGILIAAVVANLAGAALAWFALGQTGLRTRTIPRVRPQPT